MTLVDFASGLAIILLFVILAWLVWESNVVISERNRLRKETGKYYDLDIVEELEKREREKLLESTKPKKITANRKRKS